LFLDSYPGDGEPNEPVIEKVKEFIKHGAEVALWTCREERLLEEAVERCKKHGIEFASINENTPSQLDYMAERAKEGDIFATRKIYADFYADDKAKNLDIFLAIKVKETCDAFASRGC